MKITKIKTSERSARRSAQCFKDPRVDQRGQVMLLTTLILSGTILAAATLAGLLMVYQIRQSSDATQSTKAIYAADAGIEYELFKVYRKNDPNFSNACAEIAPNLSASGAEVDSKTTKETNANGNQDLVIVSTGISNNRARAFSLNLGELAIEPCASGGENEEE
ncbi:MAG: hypothetical protein Q8Q32_02360 [bacterium]|nr:hypothetical protein [bacterium]